MEVNANVDITLKSDIDQKPDLEHSGAISQEPTRLETNKTSQQLNKIGISTAIEESEFGDQEAIGNEVYVEQKNGTGQFDHSKSSNKVCWNITLIISAFNLIFLAGGA